MAAPTISAPMCEFVNASEELMQAIAKGTSFTAEEHGILNTLLPLLIDYVMMSERASHSSAISTRKPTSDEALGFDDTYTV